MEKSQIIHSVLSSLMYEKWLAGKIKIDTDRRNFYHVKLGNWQVLKVTQIDIGHQIQMPSLSNIILLKNDANRTRSFSYEFPKKWSLCTLFSCETHHVKFNRTIEREWIMKWSNMHLVLTFFQYWNLFIRFMAFNVI